MDYQLIRSLLSNNQIEEALKILSNDPEFVLDKYATAIEFTKKEEFQVSCLLPIPDKINEYIKFLDMLFFMNGGKNLAYNLAKGLVKCFPKHPKVNHLFSGLNCNLGIYPLAEKYILAAIKLDSNDPELYISLGVLKAQFLGDIEGSLADFKKALDIDPNLLSAHVNLASTYNLRHEYEKEEYHLRKAYEIDPDEWMVLFNYAVFFILIKKDKEEFLSLLSQFEEKYPDHPYLEHLYYYKEIEKNRKKKKA